ncbi:hypothetical protein PCANC_27810 [Puccinia coronata f. sp. avenae]|uniref:No apical meristem-associated C-terminal domain-containing protein n=1 Tax=Puccinia coronata f. sp. avenae TaxID=200324 RepID=A0A2N5RXA5_9BASI|nr:hypothetical protein PCANC_27810 [Puccinia coronata f. sp. avenae]
MDEGIAVWLSFSTGSAPTTTKYHRWRDHCTGHAQSLWSPCSEIYGLLDQNRIHHRDLNGITKQIYDLESSYHAARNWKRNGGAVILTISESSDPIMGSRSVAEPLHIRKVNLCRPTYNLSSKSSRSRRQQSSFGGPSSNKKKKHRKKSELAGKKDSSTRVGKSKSKDNILEDVFLKSILMKQQAKMIQAQAIAANAKVSYMKQLREMGFDLAQTAIMVDKAFPAVPNLANDSESGSSDSSHDDENRSLPFISFFSTQYSQYLA